MKKYKIFVSGVQRELAEERLAVKEVITQNALLKKYFSIFLFEDLPAKSKPAENVYLGKVLESDILLLLLGKEYGQPGSDGLSAIEREFRKALERNLKILAYLSKERDSARNRSLRNLIKEIRSSCSGYIYKEFNDIPDLKESVFNSLVELLEDEGILAKLPFDSTICEDTTYEDINEKLVENFLKYRAIKLKVEVPEISIRDFLIKTIKAVRELDGVFKPTNAAIFFFCNYPQEFISQSSVKVARYRGNTRIEFIDSHELTGPFYKILDDVEMFYKRNTRLASKIVEFKRVDIPEYPFEAIREGIVNAMAHRDYLRIGSNIQMDIFDDRIEVTSPGGLLPGLDIKNLEGVHETRNKRICKIFHETKDMERYGTGIVKMKNWMTEHGLKPPIITQPGDFFRITFYGPGDNILDLVPSIPEERQTDLKELGLNDRQIEALRLMVNEGKALTNIKYRELFNVSNQTFVRDMRLLSKLEFVTSEGKGRSLQYKAK
ncbi:DUF4062 domain-containing protein [candidate division WOR-3 bacterium]|nr:DUF4062 domain-containing protein [candidate division WOR-3 bacterium]MCK4329044.1 DUF4062 domain-containing protein [candidate division WOR-3 bacterium]